MLTFIILAVFDVLTTGMPAMSLPSRLFSLIAPILAILAFRAVMLLQESGWTAIRSYRLFTLLMNQGKHSSYGLWTVN